MNKAGLSLLVMAFAFASATAQQQPPSQTTPTGQVPSSLQGSAQEKLPPPPPQAIVKSSNLVEAADKPSDTDVYCSGFIAPGISPVGVVRAGWDTPHQTRYVDPEYIYINGSGFQEGAQYLIVRKLRDADRWEAFPGQYKAISAVGQPYGDIARAQIVQGGIRGSYAIAEITQSCETVTPGDYAIAYSERPDPEFRYTGSFDPFTPPNGKLAGRIVFAKDADQDVGTYSVVYLNVGSNDGVKPGDYFHVTRSYTEIAKDPADSISFKSSTYEDTQANRVKFPKTELANLPRRALGQLMILSTQPKSSTGLITFSLETLKVGDGVEAFEPPPPPPPPAPPAPTTPTISCTAAPDTVNKGESANINCQAASPDNHPISVSFTSNAGVVTPHDNNAVLDTALVTAPAAVTVTGTVTDDRNQTASSAATVNVNPAPAPPPAVSQQIVFRPRGSYVDNRAKAILDGVALQLQQQSDATAVVIGRSDKGENKILAQRRADNVKKYLTASKGIDPKRIDARTSPTPGKLAEVWVVPAGGSLPDDAGSTAPPAQTEAPAPHHVRHKKAATKAAAPAAH